MKTAWYPRPHDMRHSWANSLESTADNQGTIYPILMYDEGLGNPSAYEANPENAAFVTTDSPNCYPESRIESVITQFNISMGAIAFDDNIPAIRVGYMPIMMAFKEPYIAIDELTSEEVQDVLELTTESTDRQGYPLWNTINMAEKFTNGGLLGAGVLGLTANQKIEGVAFSIKSYYSMLQYKTNSGMLKKSQGGLKWLTLTPNRPVAKIKIRLRSSVKRMNPYTFFGVFIEVPDVGSSDQYAMEADVTADALHVYTDVFCRYNEWNQDFDFRKVSA